MASIFHYFSNGLKPPHQLVINLPVSAAHPAQGQQIFEPRNEKDSEEEEEEAKARQAEEEASKTNRNGPWDG